MLRRKWLIALFLILPVALITACTPQAGTPTPEEEVVEAPTEDTQPTDAATEETPAETEALQDLVLLDQNYWVQDGENVFTVFFFENPNTSQIISDLNYTIYLYDADGAQIQSDSDNVLWIYPGQKMGITAIFTLANESVAVGSVSIDWTYDWEAADDVRFPFTVEKTHFWQNGDNPMVTGTVSSSSDDTYTNLRANIICFDADDEIVGGGVSTLEFIPAGDYMGFASFVDTYGEVARVEVYPAFTYYTTYYKGSDFWSEIGILDDHFYTDDFGTPMGGLVIENNLDTVLIDSLVYVTFYDDAGNITSTATQPIDILLPNDRLGLSPWPLTPPEGAITSSYDILILPGDYENDYELDKTPLNVGEVSLTGEFNDTVTVNFTNTYDKQVSEADVFVLLYDADGNIIGGGSDWTTDPIPAGETVELDVWVEYAEGETVDSIEAWAYPNHYTTYD
ncbi:MAG: FxLYD domain-containing protein [Chloroflexota bacterium]|nr:FxLYD domain-containing protein [Chloroflexota bacterium]